MKLKLAHFNRYLWQEPNLIVVTGEAHILEEQRLAYHQRHGIALPDASSALEIPRLMAGVGLALTLTTKPDSWGWTLTLEDSSIGYFAGAEPEGMVCARVRQADPGKIAMAVQRQEDKGILRQSNYTPSSGDPLVAIEGYFTQSDQIPTRLASDEKGRAALVQVLPGASLDRVADLSEADLVELVWGMAAEGSITLLHEMLLFYECRCSDERILDMLLSLPSDHRRDVWDGQSSLKIECPRCGRVYVVNRA